jgi:hypothetical protein
MSGEADKGRRSEVKISGGTVNTGGGDLFGGDKIIGQQASIKLDEALQPLVTAINAAPEDKRNKALSDVETLKQEAAKGEKRDDGVVAKLVEGIVDLIPGATSAVVSAFATPILGGIAGPVTQYVLGKITGK